MVKFAKKQCTARVSYREQHRRVKRVDRKSLFQEAASEAGWMETWEKQESSVNNWTRLFCQEEELLQRPWGRNAWWRARTAWPQCETEIRADYGVGWNERALQMCFLSLRSHCTIQRRGMAWLDLCFTGIILGAKKIGLPCHTHMCTLNFLKFSSGNISGEAVHRFSHETLIIKDGSHYAKSLKSIKTLKILINEKILRCL